MKHGSLFSGIGGFDLAAEWAGWENIFHCEWNEFGRRVLNYYWPKSISYEDITKVNFRRYRGTIDILTGGFPCQPYSSAGKRLGKEDDRHLWPEMLRAIREISPTWIVGENVLGLTNWNGGLVFEEVQTDLESEGYEVQPFILPAAGVGAPHRRDRVWFVAYSNKCTAGPSRTSRETESDWSKNNDEQSSRRKPTEQHNRCSDVLRVDTDTNSEPKCKETKRGRQISSKERQEVRNEYKTMGGTEDACNATSERLERSSGQSLQRRGVRPSKSDWGEWPTQPPICGGDDGLPTELDGITFPKWRNESIKAYGNAIVPQVAYQIFKAINEYKSTNS